MIRKLILTPSELGYMSALNDVFNDSLFIEKNEPIDITHVLLSSLTMAGVDNIQSFGKLEHTQTTLIKKISSKSSINKWKLCTKEISEAFKKYDSGKLSQAAKSEMSSLSYKISGLLYAMKSNSSILLLSNADPLKNKFLIPEEIRIPSEILFTSIQTKSICLPIVKQEIETINIKRILEVLNSKEFRIYQEAQSEIELNENLTDKTVKLIERAGKELYKKNVNILNLKNNLVQALPLSSKVIDLFFGKLPGILTEYVGNILTDYLKLNKTIPMYNCHNIWSEIFISRIKKFKGNVDNIPKEE